MSKSLVIYSVLCKTSPNIIIREPVARFQRLTPYVMSAPLTLPAPPGSEPPFSILLSFLRRKY